MRMNRLALALSGIVATSMINVAFAGGPWMYSEGEGAAGVAMVQELFDRAWVNGSASFDPPKVHQENLWLWGQYGYSDKIMLTGLVGYTQSSLYNSTYEYSGMADSRFGLQYQFLNEWENGPITANLTSALILKGSYERAGAGRPHSPGDKANGLEIGAQLGRFLSSNINVWSDLGYRAMLDDVPDEWFFGLGSSLYINSFNFDVAWKTKRSTSGLDIKGTGFNPTLFHETREEREWLEWNAGYTFAEQFSVGLTYGKVLTGSNTGDAKIYSLALGYSF